MYVGKTMEDLVLKMNGDVRIVVPNQIIAITTFVMLEQEDWFESEVKFVREWLRPGMTAIDIGANLGVYALTMAKRVTESGRVYAFEPASSSRDRLLRSSAENGFQNLIVSGFAISDMDGTGWLMHGASSELNTLAKEDGDSQGEKEAIQLRSLDSLQRELGWKNIDFVKIDAEGTEERIIKGAETLFRESSPLVMFEIREAQDNNENLRTIFEGLGYTAYSLLDDGPMLVPCPAGTKLDTFLLNMFACKPDLARVLEDGGWLASRATPFQPTDDDRRAGLALIECQPFAQAFPNITSNPSTVDPDYLDALAAYAVWRDRSRRANDRYGAVTFALDKLASLDVTGFNSVRLATLCRVAQEAGQRMLAHQSALQLFKALRELLENQGEFRITEPFWPCTEHFDSINPGADFGEWFVISVSEAVEKTGFHSRIFGSIGISLNDICKSRFSSVEMERRLVLGALLSGHKIPEAPRITVPASDNLNAEFWQQFVTAHADR